MAQPDKSPKIHRPVPEQKASQDSFFRKPGDSMFSHEGNNLFTQSGAGFFGKKTDTFSNRGSNISQSNTQVQPKLSVNEPGDVYEKEADTVADSVMRMPAPVPAVPVEKKKEEELQAKEDEILQTKEKIHETPIPITLRRKEEEDETIQAKGDGVPEVTPGFEQGLQSTKGGGSPLPDGVKQQMESGIGADFSNVRIHTGGSAAALSSNIQAQAFTHGSDIYFNEGKYSPGTDSGKHLLAHELTHTVQQGAAGKAVQRTPGDGNPGKPEQKSYYIVTVTITVKPPITDWSIYNLRADNAIRAKLQTGKYSADDIAHVNEVLAREVHWEGFTAADTKAAEAAGKVIYGITRPGTATATQTGTEKTAGDNKKPASTGDQAEKEIDELMKKLPPEISSQLDRPHSEADRQKILKVLQLLQQFPPGGYSRYAGMVNRSTPSLDELIKSLTTYLGREQERQMQTEKRETIETKLYGLEGLYNAYLEIGKVEDDYQAEARKENPDIDKMLGYSAELDTKRAALTASLKENGFSGIKEFEGYISRYIQSFQQETIRIGEDLLLQYRHFLYTEAEKLDSDSYVTSLYQQLIGSGAKQHYANEKSARDQAGALRMGSDHATSEHWRSVGKLEQEAGSEQEAGNTAVGTLQTPLVQEEQFNRKDLAEATSKAELKAKLKAYIADKQASVDETWDDIHANPENVFELDKLIQQSMAMQQVKKGSIYEMIISQQMKEIAKKKLLKTICFIVVSLALAVLTFGATVPESIAIGLVSAGISIYSAYEAVEDYKRQNAANDVGLLTDDPSLVWVVVAIAGAALDTGVFMATLKNAKNIAAAGKAFNDSGDLVQFEKDVNELYKLKEINGQVRDKILEAGRAKDRMRDALHGMVKADGNLYMTIPFLKQTGKLLETAFFLAKKGVLDFQTFLLELKAAKIIENIEKLTADERLMLKEAFEEGKAMANGDMPVPQHIEDALKDAERIEQAGSKVKDVEHRGGTDGEPKMPEEETTKSPKDEHSNENKEPKKEEKPAPKVLVDRLKLFMERLEKLGLKKLKNEVESISEELQVTFLNDFDHAADDTLKALNDKPDLIDFWKSFANEPFLDGLMRARYIRDITILPTENIQVLKQIISFRKKAAQILIDSGIDIKTTKLAEVNICFTTYSYKLADGTVIERKILAFSGDEPALTIMGKVDNIDGYEIVKKVSGKNSKRFFGYTISTQAQDSEAKAIEHLMNDIARTKGMKFGNNDMPKDFIDALLLDVDLKVNMASEMYSCPSCSEIIKNFNISNANKVNFRYGTKYP